MGSQERRSRPARKAQAQSPGLAFIWTHRYKEMNKTAIQPLVEVPVFG